MTKAVFLDRDGVINRDHGYIGAPEQFDFLPGVFTACWQLQQAGYQLIIVTNQSGIGRGYYTEQQFVALTEWMTAAFERHGIRIDGVYFCPHHPDKAQPPYRIACDCRKPAPGMLLTAAKEHDIALPASVMIGDKESDMQAADAAGVPQRIILAETLTEHATARADSLLDALRHIP